MLCTDWLVYPYSLGALFLFLFLGRAISDEGMYITTILTLSMAI